MSKITKQAKIQDLDTQMKPPRTKATANTLASQKVVLSEWRSFVGRHTRVSSKTGTFVIGYVEIETGKLIVGMFRAGRPKDKFTVTDTDIERIYEF